MRIEGEIDHAVEDQSVQRIGVARGIGLRELRAVALAVEPDLRLADRRAEVLQVLDRDLGRQMRQEIGMRRFGQAVLHEGPGRADRRIGMVERERSAVSKAKPALVQRMPFKRADAALVEEDDVHLLGQARVVAGEIALDRLETAAARPADDIEEHALALPTGEADGETDGDRLIGAGLVTDRPERQDRHR